ncbi:MAG: AAA family ATPase, partial [Bacteroidetes bacterium]|nr:AAA family ATPase [Bacteroidota bacterium]
VLDDGRLTDNKGRLVNFKNTIIIMTSNMGAHYIQEKFEELNEYNKDALMVIIKDQVLDLLKRHLRPEFLNRIDEAIVFAPLSEADMKDIVRIQARGLVKKLKEMDVSLTFEDEALDLIASLGYDPQFGARPVKRILQKEVVNQLSKEILAGNILRDSKIKVVMRNGMIRFEQDKVSSN